MIELRHLRTLTALRDAGTLAGAAERLHLTQSALSHQLKELEDRLSLVLFERKARPLKFTAAGERLLALAERILPEIAAARSDLRRMAAGDNGRLFIAVECHSCFEWLIPAMDEYRPRRPEVELDVTLAYNFEPLPALVRGDLDVVITSDPQPRADIDYVPLFRYQGVLVIANDHALARKPYVRPADLGDQTLITYPVERSRLDIFRHFLDPAGVTPAEHRTTELTVIMLQLVASHRGVAALPNWAVQEYVDRNYVQARPLGCEGLWGTLYAATRKSLRQAAYLQDFINIARAVSFRHLKGIQPSSDDKVGIKY